MHKSHFVISLQRVWQAWQWSENRRRTLTWIVKCNYNDNYYYSSTKKLHGCVWALISSSVAVMRPFECNKCDLFNSPEEEMRKKKCKQLFISIISCHDFSSFQRWELSFCEFDFRWWLRSPIQCKYTASSKTKLVLSLCSHEKMFLFIVKAYTDPRLFREGFVSVQYGVIESQWTTTSLGYVSFPTLGYSSWIT